MLSHGRHSLPCSSFPPDQTHTALLRTQFFEPTSVHARRHSSFLSPNMIKCIRPASCQGDADAEAPRQAVLTAYLTSLFTNSSVPGADAFTDDVVLEHYGDLLCVEPYKGESGVDAICSAVCLPLCCIPGGWESVKTDLALTLWPMKPINKYTQTLHKTTNVLPAGAPGDEVCWQGSYFAVAPPEL